MKDQVVFSHTSYTDSHAFHVKDNPIIMRPSIFLPRKVSSQSQIYFPTKYAMTFKL